MLIFSRAEVPTYRRGRAGDGGASDGQMHSTVFMMQRHFYNRLLAAVFCGWRQLSKHGVESVHVSKKVEILLLNSVPQCTTNLKTQSFSHLMQIDPL